MRRAFSCTLLCALLSSSVAYADEVPRPDDMQDPTLPSATAPAKDLPKHPEAANPPHHKDEVSDETFKFRASVDLPIAIGATGTWIVLAALSKQLSSSCRWCDDTSSGRDGLNSFDRGGRDTFKWSRTSVADTLSTVSGFVALPLFAVGVDLLGAGSPRRWQRWAMDVLILSEAVTIAGALNYGIKYAASRQRPYVHYEVLEGVKFKSSVDDNASFYSGHTSFAFSVAAAAGTIASVRHYKLAPVIWAVGMGLATLTGYLRVAADKHYVSDVIVGAAVSSAVGVVVPLTRWIRPLRQRKISIGGQTGNNGALLSVSGDW